MEFAEFFQVVSGSPGTSDEACSVLDVLKPEFSVRGMQLMVYSWVPFLYEKNVSLGEAFFSMVCLVPLPYSIVSSEPSLHSVEDVQRPLTPIGELVTLRAEAGNMRLYLHILANAIHGPQ